MTVLVPDINETDQRKINLCIQQIAAGRSNAVGDVTLTANAATTVVSDLNCSENSLIMFMPTTANAATEFGAGTLRVSTIANKTFTITHANNAQIDRTFRYAIYG